MEASRPPIYVSGGKRLNFSREDEYESGVYHDSFTGYGKSEGCYPSCSWEELCALAKLVVEHPAFRLPESTTYYPAHIDDEPVSGREDNDGQ